MHLLHGSDTLPAYHRWPRYPHPSIEVETRTTPPIAKGAPLRSTLDNKDNGEVLPVPMVSVTRMVDEDDDDLSSYMEVS